VTSIFKVGEATSVERSPDFKGKRQRAQNQDSVWNIEKLLLGKTEEEKVPNDQVALREASPIF